MVVCAGQDAGDGAVQQAPHDRLPQVVRATARLLAQKKSIRLSWRLTGPKHLICLAQKDCSVPTLLCA